MCKHVSRKVNKLEKNNKELENADIVEYDNNGNIVGYGSHADYDYYATEVQNGQGYYDDDGHYHRY